MVLVPRTREKLHPLAVHPTPHRPRLTVAHPGRLVVQRRLAEPFFVDARRVQQMVRDDGIEHPHAAFVKDAHDRCVALQFRSQFFTHSAGGGGQLRTAQGADVAGRVGADAGLEPLFQRGGELPRSEILAPEGRVGHVRLGERAVEVEHPHQSRPGTRPIGDRQDGSLVGNQAVQ